MTSMINRRRQGGKKRFDFLLLKKLLIRVLTRNEPSPGKAFNDRLALEKNFLTLNQNPEGHLAYVLSVLDKLAATNQAPAFETGIMMGVTMALSAGTEDGRVVLAKILRDIEAQQDVVRSSPPAENSGMMLPIDDPTAAPADAGREQC